MFSHRRHEERGAALSNMPQLTTICLAGTFGGLSSLTVDRELKKRYPHKTALEAAAQPVTA